MIEKELLNRIVCEYDYEDGYDAIMEMVSKASFDDGIYNLYCSFDIETSKLQDIQIPEVSFNYCYKWQFMVMANEDDYVYVSGRYKDEFFALVRRLKNTLNNKLVIYVQFLAYEYFNLKDDFDDVMDNDAFFRNSRKPLKLGNEKMVEFRCSKELSGKGLSKMAEDVNLYKADNYDYNKERNSKTPLTMEEDSYCFYDVYIVCCWVKWICEGHCKSMGENCKLSLLPLTITGFLRRYVAKKYAYDKTYTGQMRSYYYKNCKENHKFMKRIFRGGECDLNHNYAYKILSGVKHKDLSSCHAGIMTTRKFPQSNFTFPDRNTITTQELLDRINDGYAVIMTVTFVNLRVKKGIPSPCILKDWLEYGWTTSDGVVWTREESEMYDRPYPQLYTVETGTSSNAVRVKCSPLARVSITELDFFSIRDMYDFDDIIVQDYGYCIKKELPFDLKNLLYELYEIKTKYKGVKDKFSDYMMAKIKLSSVFGLCGTDPESKKFKLVDGEIVANEEDTEFKTITLMPYSYAIYVTAYARRFINQCKIILGDSFIYSDTDSVFYFENERFEEWVARYNEDVRNKHLAYTRKPIFTDAFVDKETADKLNDLSVYYEYAYDCCFEDTEGLIPDYDKLLEWYNDKKEQILNKRKYVKCPNVFPMDINNNIHFLGKFEDEDDIDLFIGLCPKRYVCAYLIGDCIKLDGTFAGLRDCKATYNKETGEYDLGDAMRYILDNYDKPEYKYGLFDIFREVGESDLVIELPFKAEREVIEGEFEGYCDGELVRATTSYNINNNATFVICNSDVKERMYADN